MFLISRQKRSKVFLNFTVLFVLINFIFSLLIPFPLAYAQSNAGSLGLIPQQTGTQSISLGFPKLPPPGSFMPLSPGFHPVVLKGIKVYPQNPFHFDFIIDTGNSKLKEKELKQESTKLIKYFLASLTVPENEMWVNLSPYERERIIPESFGVTEMGRDMLVQDYLLKQLTASLIYPEHDLGKSFWDKVYQKAHEVYGTTNIPVNTFNKVWILPERAVVYEHEGMAFVGESELKVMLDHDYQALKLKLWKKDRVDGSQAQKAHEVNDLSGAIVKELILPAIEKEVNEGENFAPLRQIYHSLILAAWYKRTLKGSLLGQQYVDQNKVNGIDLVEKDVKQQIYIQYLEAFKKGVYNYIREDYDPYLQESIPRKYFSGGIEWEIDQAIHVENLSKDPQAGSKIRGIIAGFAMLASVVFTNSLDSQESPPEKSQDQQPPRVLEVPNLLSDILQDELKVTDQIMPIEVPGYIQKLNDPDDLVRLSSVEALSKDSYYGIRKVIEALTRKVKEKNPSIRRAALMGLQKIAEGNAQAIREVTVSLQDSDSFVKEEAVVTLRKIVTKYYPEVVKAVMGVVDDPQVRLEAVRTLGKIAFGDREAITTLVKATKDDTIRGVKYTAIEALEQFASENEEVITALAEVLRDNEWLYFSNAKDILKEVQVGKINIQKAVEALAGAYQNKDRHKRRDAIEALGHIGHGSSQAVEILAQAILDADSDVSEKAAEALAEFDFGGLSRQPAITSLIKLLVESRRFDDSHQRSLKIIGFRNQFAIDHLIGLLKHPNEYLRAQALNIFKDIVKRGEQKLIQAALDLLKDPEKSVRSMAAKVLGKIITGKQDDVIEALIKAFRESDKKEYYYNDAFLVALRQIDGKNPRVLDLLHEIILDNTQHERTKKLAADLLNEINSANLINVYTIGSLNEILKPSEKIPKGFTQDDHRFRIYRFGGSKVYSFDYTRALNQGKALDRIAVFIEKEGYKGRILTEGQMEVFYDKEHKIVIYDGHDYQLPKIAEFFNLARQNDIELNQDEERLLEVLELLEILKDDPNQGYIGDEEAVIISLSQESTQREAILKHEVGHALYFSSPVYREKVKEMYARLTEGEKEFVKTFLAFKGYDIEADEELLLTEYAAYFQDGQTLATHFDELYTSNIGGGDFEDKKTRRLWEKLRRIYDEDGDEFILHGRVKAQINPGAVRFLERQTEALGQLYDSFIHPEDQERIDDLGKPFKPQQEEFKLPEEKPKVSITSKVERMVGGVPIIMKSIIGVDLILIKEEVETSIKNASHDALLDSRIKRRLLEAIKTLDSKGKVKIFIRGQQILILELDKDDRTIRSDEELKKELEDLSNRAFRDETPKTEIIPLRGQPITIDENAEKTNEERSNKKDKAILTSTPASSSMPEEGEDNRQDIISRRNLLGLILFSTVATLSKFGCKLTGRLEDSLPSKQEGQIKKSFFIVGTYHKGPQAEDDRRFQEGLVKLSSEGKIVLGLEGIARDEQREEDFVRAAYNLEKGNIYGFEDDFANIFAGILLYYGNLVYEIQDEISINKIGLVLHLRENPTFQKIWGRLKDRPLFEPGRRLYDQIDNYLTQNVHLDIKALVVKFEQSVDQYGENSDWMQLYKELALVMSEEAKDLPKDLRPDVERIQQYIASPKESGHTQYIVEEVNNKWRNKFIAKHMREIAEVAAQKGLDAYILIGAGHVAHISSLLSNRAGTVEGLKKRVYYRTNLVPEKFLPKTETQTKKDKAVLTKPKEVGGIDFDPANLNLEIRRDKDGQPPPLSPLQTESIKIDGLVPIIINIVPLTNMNLLLGTHENTQKPQLSQLSP